MLEPQSTAFFLLLMTVFGGMVLCAVLAKQPVFRLLAASLAFIPAMLFGVAAVNKYYSYYETWGAVVADFTNRGVQNIPQVPAVGAGSAQAFDRLLGSDINIPQASKSGAEIGLSVHGAASRIVRGVIVYLPPQYFQKEYAAYRFPVIELIHGQPGEPQDWLAALNVQTTLQDLVLAHQANPVVLVMPDVNGGRRQSLQCLNQVGGAADETFVAADVPDFVAARIRVQPPGQAWGIAGYSEGGYCAANLALRHPRRYGFAGVLSGYFQPTADRIIVKHALTHVDPFRNNPVLRLQNSPSDILRRLPVGSAIPEFWVGAALGSSADVATASAFVAELRPMDPATPLVLTRDGRHNGVAWRAMIPAVLRWMTTRLALVAALGCPTCSNPPASAPATRPSPQNSLSHLGALANPGPGLVRVPQPAGAAPLAALGVARLPGKARPATG